MMFTDTVIKRIRLAAFLLTIALAAAIPLHSVIQYEFPANPPRQYLVPISGYDPVDLFRGHYLRLNAATECTLEHITTDDLDYSISDDYRYAIVTTDAQTGLAKFTPVVNKPESGDYIPVEWVYRSWEQRNRLAAEKQKDPEQAKLPQDKVKPYHPQVEIRFPDTLHRFYLNEKLAPEAESVIGKLQAQPGKVCLLLNIYDDGRYTVTDLYFDGMPFREYLKKNPQ